MRIELPMYQDATEILTSDRALLDSTGQWTLESTWTSRHHHNNSSIIRRCIPAIALISGVCCKRIDPTIEGITSKENDGIRGDAPAESFAA